MGTRGDGCFVRRFFDSAADVRFVCLAEPECLLSRLGLWYAETVMDVALGDTLEARILYQNAVDLCGALEVFFLFAVKFEYRDSLVGAVS